MILQLFTLFGKNRILHLLLIIASSLTFNAQTASYSPNMSNVTGGSGNVGTINYNWTLGEPFVKAGGNTCDSIYSGFQHMAIDTPWVVKKAPPLAIVGASVYCQSTPLHYLQAFGGNTYLWSNGVTTSTMQAVISGNYSVKTINTCGDTLLSDTVAIKVLMNPTITIVPTTTVICRYDSLGMSVSGANTYTWNTGSHAIGFTLSPSVTVNYSVVGTATNGCVSNKSISITVNPLPIINATTSNTALCIGYSRTLTATGATTYTWSNGVTTASTNVTPNSSSIYTVIATDSNSCINTKTIALTVNYNPTVTVSASSPTICNGFNTNINALGATTYSWSNASISATTPVSPTITTTYTVIGLNNFGCADTNMVTVNVVYSPTISIASSNTAICIGKTNQFTATGAVNYTWTPSTVLSNSLIANPIVTPIVTGLYSVTGNSNFGCLSTSTVALIVNPLPVISISSPSVICAGQTATISTSGASTYTWNNTNTTPTILETPIIPTHYTVTGTDGNGCVNTQTLYLNVLITPTITVTGSPTVCLGYNDVLSVTGGPNYIWSSGQTNSTINVSPLVNTTYSVTSGYSPCTATQTLSVTVLVPITPTVSATPSTIIYNYETSVLVANGNGSMQWNPTNEVDCPTCPTISVKPESTTTYTVTQTDSNGCTSTNTVLVTVEIICGELFVPKGFSPNNDEKNDTWCIYDNCIKELFVQVYNRWGEKVFETNDRTLCWDGYYNGILQNSGVFAYQLIATLITGEKIDKKGNVTLVR